MRIEDFSAKSETAETAYPQPVDNSDRQLQKVMSRIAVVLSEESVPVGGISTRRMRHRFPWHQRRHLKQALRLLEARGAIVGMPVIYQSRPGLCWALTGAEDFDVPLCDG